MDRDIETLVDEMTLEEQVRLLAGEDLWNVAAIPRLGIGALRVSDGPNGARGGLDFVTGTKTAAFPVGIAIGATWNPDLVREIGAALALETRDKGAAVLLGPTINLQRGPLNGRNFECYSEDPVLTASLASAYIEGLQSGGVAATPKHFVANESEIRRTVVSSDVDERALRELYLVPFEAAVKKAGTWALMSSYNRLNGIYTAEEPWLLTEVLRGDWGYDGLVMSDWFGLHSTVEGTVAGLDLEMPGPAIHRGAKLVEAVEAGEVPRETVRDRALNVLRLLERVGDLGNMAPRREVEDERAETRALIRRAGAEAMVLLKNEGALPLPKGAKIAVIGPNARTAQVMGGGSAQINAYRRVSPWDGLSDVLGEEALSYAEGCRNHRFEPVLGGMVRREWFSEETVEGDPATVDEAEGMQRFMGEVPEGIDENRFGMRVTGSFTAPVAGTYRFGMHCTGRGRLKLDGTLLLDAWDDWTRGATMFEEGCDPITCEREMEAGERVEVMLEFVTKPPLDLHVHGFHVGVGRVLGQAEIDYAAEVAAGADVAVVCVGRTAEWDTEGWDLPDMALPGAQDALVEAVAAPAKRIVVVLQSGGPVEMPWLGKVDAVVQAWYPGQEAGHAIADVLTGSADPGGRLAQTIPKRLEDAPTFAGTSDLTYPGEDGHVRYAEGLSIGYRHHAAPEFAPAFPFGFGLSYTSFTFGETEIALDATGAGKVTIPVTNTGERAGSTVVQLYIAPPRGADRPPFELKGFAKLHLGAGESGTATITLTPRAFARFDPTAHAWVVDAGTYDLRIARDASDDGASRSVQIAGQRLPV